MYPARTFTAAAIGVLVAIGGAGCGGAGGAPSRAERVAKQITDTQHGAADVTCTNGSRSRFSCKGDVPGAHGTFDAVSNSQGLYLNLSPGVNPVINDHSVRGRVLRFAAALPTGWFEQPHQLSVYPDLMGIQLPVRFASFRLPKPGPIWQVRGIPQDGVVVGLFPEKPVSSAAVNRAKAPVIERPGQRSTSDSTNAYWAGWRFRVWADFGRRWPRPSLVRQVNKLVGSIVVVGHLCPCPPQT